VASRTIKRRSILRLTAVALGLTVAGQAAASTYSVRSGDTLSGIADQLGTTVKDLANLNGLRSIDRIFAGQTLQTPGQEAIAVATSADATYVVQKGDNLSKLATRFGTTVAALAKANGLKTRSRIRIGQTLKVPFTAMAVSTRLPARLRMTPARLILMPLFDKWAAAYGVPADLLKAMTWMESGWQNGKVSSTGARGIGQLMPATVAFVSQQLIGTPLDPRRPEDNIRMSARYLRYLLDVHGGSVPSALAAYYQGIRSIRERGLYKDTKTYVSAIINLRPAFR
jgi:LysM repeat protein